MERGEERQTKARILYNASDSLDPCHSANQELTQQQPRCSASQDTFAPHADCLPASGPCCLAVSALLLVFISPFADLLGKAMLRSQL